MARSERIKVKNIDKYIQDLIRIADNRKTVFAIQATSLGEREREGYFLPIRLSDNTALGGVCNFDEVESLRYAQYVDGVVDYVAVDCEKKLGVHLGDGKYLTGALDKRVFELLEKSKQVLIKPNDITVEAIFDLCIDQTTFVSGAKVGIIGVGNIGFKCALKLTEAGAEVSLWDRKTSELNTVATTLNIVKPKGTLATPRPCNTIEQACIDKDILISCVSASDIVNGEHIKLLNQNALVIDVGKGNLAKGAVQVINETDKTLVRLDVGYQMIRKLEAIMFRNDLGRPNKKRVGKLTIVSGGAVGESGAVIVDNVSEPRFIIGLCDGAGGIDSVTNQQRTVLLEELKKSDR
jgi:hypothetical protein